MSGRTAAIVIAICVAVGVASVCLFSMGLLNGPDEEYSISYDLNGGTSDNPSVYHSSKGLTLNDAVHPYRGFGGWYDDDGNKVERIAAGTTGDIHLTAVFPSYCGTEIRYSVTGNSYLGATTGTATLTYMADNGECYLVDLEATYSDGLGTAIISECLELRDSISGYDIVFDDERIPVTIDWDYTYGHIQLNHVATNSTMVKDTVTIDASSDGIDIDGTGTYEMGQGFTLTPDVDERLYLIDGWYIDDRKVSGEFQLRCDHAYMDVSYTFKAKRIDTGILEATNAGEIYVLRSDVELSSGTWDIKMKSTGESILQSAIQGISPTYIFSEEGIYTVSVQGKDMSGSSHSYSYDLLVDDVIPKTFQWMYKEKRYEMTVGIPYHVYYAYSTDTDVSREQDNYVESNNTVYATFMDPVILDASSKLREIARNDGLNDYDTAGLVLAFVQYIEYTSDTKNGGEYWNYAVETLFEQHGDCEDTSMLFCALMRPMGFMVCEMVFKMPGHMSAGIALKDTSVDYGTYNKGNGIFYYFCETSEKRYIGYEVGQVPGGKNTVFTNNAAKIYTVGGDDVLF